MAGGSAGLATHYEMRGSSGVSSRRWPLFCRAVCQQGLWPISQLSCRKAARHQRQLMAATNRSVNDEVPRCDRQQRSGKSPTTFRESRRCGG